jgi:hypothetical protein
VLKSLLINLQDKMGFVEGGKQMEQKGTFSVKAGLAQMLKGGVIMDVTTPEQAKLLKKLEHVQLWLWKGFLLISERLGE